jgi:1-acyl-sn-glycerol-3-phosphate acyltransferase
MAYLVLRRALGLLFRLVWRPVIEGLEHVPATGPVIIASNHLSFIDSVVLPLAVPRRVTFLAKAEYFTGRGIRGRAMAAFFHAIGAVPVHRGGTRDETTAALEAAQQVLAAGGAFGIYPEGTRSLDGRLYRFRTGVAWLGLATWAPIVPVALSGTARMLPIGARIPRLARVTVRFAPPVETGEPARELAAAGGKGAGRVRRELTDAVMAAVAALSDQEPAGSYNGLPPA